MEKIRDHRAIPGPLYWEYRCMVCEEHVADHTWWGWLRDRLNIFN